MLEPLGELLGLDGIEALDDPEDEGDDGVALGELGAELGLEDGLLESARGDIGLEDEDGLPGVPGELPFLLQPVSATAPIQRAIRTLIMCLVMGGVSCGMTGKPRASIGPAIFPPRIRELARAGVASRRRLPYGRTGKTLRPRSRSGAASSANSHRIARVSRGSTISSMS